MSDRGQILLDSNFGKELTRLAMQSSTIVEIGTWHGEGSTICLAKGMILPSQRMWCIEQDPDRWFEASRFHRDHRIRFLRDHAFEIVEELPRRIDLILFDGGDETTDIEFDLLYSRCHKFIALDDTNDQKNRRQFAALRELRPIVSMRQDDRNGWAIFGPR